MNSEQLFALRRHIVFDPMNAHSQADDPRLLYVMRFNADEREFQERRIPKFADGTRTRRKRPHRLTPLSVIRPARKLLQQMERIQRLPKVQQRFVMQMIETVLAQQDR